MGFCQSEKGATKATHDKKREAELGGDDVTREGSPDFFFFFHFSNFSFQETPQLVSTIHPRKNISFLVFIQITLH